MEEDTKTIGTLARPLGLPCILNADGVAPQSLHPLGDLFPAQRTREGGMTFVPILQVLTYKVSEHSSPQGLAGSVSHTEHRAVDKQGLENLLVNIMTCNYHINYLWVNEDF